MQFSFHHDRTSVVKFLAPSPDGVGVLRSCECDLCSSFSVKFGKFLTPEKCNKAFIVKIFYSPAPHRQPDTFLWLHGTYVNSIESQDPIADSGNSYNPGIMEHCRHQCYEIYLSALEESVLIK